MPPPEVELQPAGGAGTSERLREWLQRIQADADLPAMAAQVQRVLQLGDMEQENLHRLTDLILQDVGLTQKLLRWVNAAPYVANRGGVATVSRAISLLGMVQVKAIAASLLLLENWDDPAQAGRMRQAFARALLAAHMAGELSGPVGPQRERAFLAALFQGLGRLLTVRCLPEVAQRIEAESQGDPAREQAAVMRHLGVSYDELAAAVSRSWGLPPDLQRSMERPRGPVPARVPTDPVEWVRWVAAAGSDLADAWLEAVRQGHGDAFERAARRYGHLVDKSPQEVVGLAQQARAHFTTAVEAIGLARSLEIPLWRAWLAEGQDDPLHPVPMAAIVPATGGPAEARPAATAAASQDGAQARADADDPALMLAQGLVDATAALLDGMPASERLELVMETLLRALRAARVWLVVPAEPGWAVARLAAGASAETLARHYRVSIDAAAVEAGGLLPALGHMRRDSCLEDVAQPKVSARLPPWYRTACPAGTAMVVLPLWRAERWLGWIHLDGRGLTLPMLGGVPRHMLRALRNLACVALMELG